MHDVHDQDRNIAQRRPARAQIGEAFVPGSVDDQQRREPVLHLLNAQLVHLLLDCLHGEERCADLLRNSASFAALHVGSTNFVQNLRFSRVNMAQDTHNWRPQLRFHSRCNSCPPLLLSPFANGGTTSASLQFLLVHGIILAAVVILRRVVLGRALGIAVTVAFALARLLAFFFLAQLTAGVIHFALGGSAVRFHLRRNDSAEVFVCLSRKQSVRIVFRHVTFRALDQCVNL
mmetsp:Transcript_8358/g.21999  ORF Transcript_8358/g.21999 Transcript_8358/m.21999 type:complete len:232 (-) Transcript_8358:1129-1824(-)